MTRFTRGLAAATLPLVLALSLAGCGDDKGAKSRDHGQPGAPTYPAPGDAGGTAHESATDADTTKFCQVFLSPPADLVSDDVDKAANASHTWAAAMAQLGTPPEITGDARAGWERLDDFLAAVGPDDMASYQSASGSDPEKVFGKEAAAAISAFLKRVDTVCAGVQPLS